MGDGSSAEKIIDNIEPYIFKVSVKTILNFNKKKFILEFSIIFY